jgi:hypothetical protein
MVALTFAGCHHDKKQADLSGETQAGEIYGRPAPGWQGMLRSHHGWMGAEGIYSVAMNSVEVHGKADCTTSGRFIPPKKICETPEICEDIDFYTDNAKTYPHLSRPEE